MVTAFAPIRTVNGRIRRYRMLTSGWLDWQFRFRSRKRKSSRSAYFGYIPISSALWTIWTASFSVDCITAWWSHWKSQFQSQFGRASQLGVTIEQRVTIGRSKVCDSFRSKFPIQMPIIRHLNFRFWSTGQGAGCDPRAATKRFCRVGSSRSEARRLRFRESRTRWKTGWAKLFVPMLVPMYHARYINFLSLLWKSFFKDARAWLIILTFLISYFALFEINYFERKIFECSTGSLRRRIFFMRIARQTASFQLCSSTMRFAWNRFKILPPNRKIGNSSRKQFSGMPDLESRKFFWVPEPQMESQI